KADIEKEKNYPPVDVAKIIVSSGKGINSTFESIGADYIIHGGQTMNPSTEDILSAIKKVNAKEIYIFPNNKNIILSTNKASKMFEQKVHVISTKAIPQGITAIYSLNESHESHENINQMNQAIEEVKTGLVTYAVRDTEVNNLKINKNDFMGI